MQSWPSYVVCCCRERGGDLRREIGTWHSNAVVGVR